MAYNVLWTDAARADVDRAVRYIAISLDSPKAANELLDAFEKAVDDIAQFPEACSIPSHRSLASRGLRVKLVKRYAMLYSFDGEMVIVSRVFHTLQDYARVFSGK